jgi:hypothetical protein
MRRGGCRGGGCAVETGGCRGESEGAQTRGGRATLMDSISGRGGDKWGGHDVRATGRGIRCGHARQEGVVGRGHY